MPKNKTIDKPNKTPSPNYNPVICYMDFKSAALFSQVLRYQVAPDGSRNQRAIAVDFGRGNISAQSKSVDIKFVHARDFLYCRAFLWSEDCFAFKACFAFWLCALNLRALPSNSRKPASARLDRALCLFGILISALPSYPPQCLTRGLL